MAPARKIIGTLVFATALIGGGAAADVMLSQRPGWAYLTYSSVAGIVCIPLIWGHEILRWWRGRSRASPRDAALPSSAIRGIPELELCRQALTRYMAAPASQVAGSEHLDGSAELYPYLADLCRILDEQQIPHPEVDCRDISTVGTGKWARFLGDLWAARHDIEQARRVHAGSRP